MTFQIDPSKASIDFDCMTMEGYSIEDDDGNTNESRPMTLTMKLSGGLGRINIEGMGSKFFDDDIKVSVDGLFTEMSSSQKTELQELMNRWQSLGTPLRFMVFKEKAVILEDGDEFIVLPPGERKVTVGEQES